MATETRSELTGHLRSVTTTTLACLLGVAAAFASGTLFGTDLAAAANRQQLFVLGAAVLVQFPAHRLLGIDIEEYGVKDYLYIAFMTITLYFIAYAIMLTTGVSL
jgi:hypothetical protein